MGEHRPRDDVDGARDRNAGSTAPQAFTDRAVIRSAPRLDLQPLLPPLSPSVRHHFSMQSTANAGVSAVVPTKTVPVLACGS